MQTTLLFLSSAADILTSKEALGGFGLGVIVGAFGALKLYHTKEYDGECGIPRQISKYQYTILPFSKKRRNFRCRFFVKNKCLIGDGPCPFKEGN